jgi:hypothetical protein
MFLDFSKMSSFLKLSKIKIFLSKKTAVPSGKTLNISAILNLNSLQSSNANINLVKS